MDSPILISGLSIENRTAAFVSAARVRVPSTGNFVSCGNISPHSVCATGFPETEYSGNPMELTWSQAGQIYSTGELQLHLTDDVLEAANARVMVTIVGPNSAGVKLIAVP